MSGFFLQLLAPCVEPPLLPLSLGPLSSACCSNALHTSRPFSSRRVLITQGPVLVFAPTFYEWISIRSTPPTRFLSFSGICVALLLRTPGFPIPLSFWLGGWPSVRGLFLGPPSFFPPNHIPCPTGTFPSLFTICSLDAHVPAGVSICFCMFFRFALASFPQSCGFPLLFPHPPCRTADSPIPFYRGAFRPMVTPPFSNQSFFPAYFLGSARDHAGVSHPCLF